MRSARVESVLGFWGCLLFCRLFSVGCFGFLDITDFSFGFFVFLQELLDSFKDDCKLLVVLSFYCSYFFLQIFVR
jgi:hypothetical protein